MLYVGCVTNCVSVISDWLFDHKQTGTASESRVVEVGLLSGFANLGKANSEMTTYISFSATKMSLPSQNTHLQALSLLVR